MKNRVINDEVFIAHTFNASAEKVFNAWTSPEKLMQWYALDGCTVKFKNIRVETGGRFHSCISNPQFGDCWAIGEYKEVLPNTKIVFTLINADENGKTRLQLHQTVSMELAKRTGAYPSWIQMLNKMQTILQ
jgi:uncharacterized protein YndB with AHSA1/START domain